jgi:hypothetical protein
MLGRGGARREIATKAPAAERNARRIDIGQTDREIDHGLHDRFPVRPQANGASARLKAVICLRNAISSLASIGSP